MANSQVAKVSHEMVERIPIDVVKRRFRMFYGSNNSPATAAVSDEVAKYWLKWGYDNVPSPDQVIDEKYVLKKHPSINAPVEKYANRAWHHKIFAPSNPRQYVIDRMIYQEKFIQEHYKAMLEGKNPYEISKTFMFHKYFLRYVLLLLLLLAPFGIIQFTSDKTEWYAKNMKGSFFDQKVCIFFAVFVKHFFYLVFFSVMNILGTNLLKVLMVNTNCQSKKILYHDYLIKRL